MEIDTVINQLRDTKAPSRRLDVSIAQIVGWRVRTETVTDMSTGETRQRHLWLVPKTDELGRVPFYTSDLESAYRLTRDIVPDEAGACTSEPGRGSAVIGEGSAVVAVNAPIALCIAALLASKSSRS